METGTVLFAERNSILFIKLQGRMTYDRVESRFNDFIDRLFKRDDPIEILLDLTEATFIDSTHLGLIAKLAKLSRSRFATETTMVSTNPAITECLQMVGFDKVFRIVDHLESTESNLEDVSANSEESTPLSRTLLEGHRELMELNDANAIRYKNVVDLLEQESDD